MLVISLARWFFELIQKAKKVRFIQLICFDVEGHGAHALIVFSGGIAGTIFCLGVIRESIKNVFYG